MTKKLSKKAQDKSKEKFLNSLDVTIPAGLREFLEPEQEGLLRCYMARCNFGDMTSELFMTRQEVISELINLGRVLGIYSLIECGLIPGQLDKSEDFLKGWLESRKQLWKEVKNESKKRKTL